MRLSINFPVLSSLKCIILWFPVLEETMHSERLIVLSEAKVLANVSPTMVFVLDPKKRSRGPLAWTTVNGADDKVMSLSSRVRWEGEYSNVCVDTLGGYAFLTLQHH